jgi:WD40 repeat protein
MCVYIYIYAHPESFTRMLFKNVCVCVCVRVCLTHHACVTLRVCEHAFQCHIVPNIECGTVCIHTQTHTHIEACLCVYFTYFTHTNIFGIFRKTSGAAYLHLYMCVYIYIYVCVCVCIYIYIYIHTYIRTSTHTHIHQHISIQICVSMYMYMYIHPHSYTCIMSLECAMLFEKISCCPFRTFRTCTQQDRVLPTMLKQTLRGHREGVSCVAISGDSKRIASGILYDGIIKLWCADTGRHVCKFQGHEDGVYSVDFKGQSTLISGGYDNLIKVWAISDGKAPALLHTLRGRGSLVYAVSVSPDGMKIASGSHNKRVMIWSVQSGKQLLTCTGHTYRVMCVAWSSDSRLVVSGGEDNTVRVWDAAEGTQVMEPLRGHTNDVSSVVLNTTTTLLFSASWDATIIIWDLDIAKRKATVRHTLQEHINIVRSISLCPDERLIVSGGDDHTVRVWEVATGQQVRLLEGHKNEVLSVAWSRDGQYIVSGSEDKTVRVWEADAQVILHVVVQILKHIHIFVHEHLLSVNHTSDT